MSGCSPSKIDLKKIDPDFYVFSGHKLYGPSGIGVLLEKKYLDQFMPYQTGGEMIDFVSIKNQLYQKYQTSLKQEHLILLVPSLWVQL